MKYYLLNAVEKLQRYSKTLDAKAILSNCEWLIFNEEGNKIKFVFRPQGELIISQNGTVSKGKWEILSTGSILIDFADKSFLYNAAFVENEILIMQLDGNNDFLVMLNSTNHKLTLLNSIKQVDKYLDNKYLSFSKPIDNLPEVDNFTETILPIIIFSILAISVIIFFVAT